MAEAKGKPAGGRARAVAALPARAWSFVRSLETRTLAAVGALVAGAWLFLELSDDVAEKDYDSLDQTILLAFRNPADPTDPLGSRGVEEAMRDVTALGGTTVVILLAVVLTAWLVLYRRRREALVFAAAVALAAVSKSLLKGLYSRERPSLVPHDAYVTTHSFPSGHSTLAAAVFLTAAVILAGLQPAKGAKRLAFTTAFIIVGAIGISRIYLGVHWPTDVLGGWTLGACWALIAHLVLKMTAPPRRSGD